MKHACPACGQQTSLTTKEREVLESVARRDGITVDQIVDRMYGSDPRGGPLCARRAVYVYINHLNTKLRRLGLRVQGENVGGPTDELGCYRLVEIGA